jgi:hypothetical protein
MVGQMKAFVYVDGFNLYRGALRRTPYKWLDLDALCRRLMPRHAIARIKNFTAPLHQFTASDLHRARNQKAYLRALATLPTVDIYFGHFLTHEIWAPVAVPFRTIPKAMLAAGAPVPSLVRVLKTEEKGSDVNLGSQLLHDAHRGRIEAAAVISNDSDLAMPIRLVARDLGIPVWVVNPHTTYSVQLRHAATHQRPLRRGVLGQSQFPAELVDSYGRFHKPTRW